MAFWKKENSHHATSIGMGRMHCIAPVGLSLCQELFSVFHTYSLLHVLAQLSGTGTSTAIPTLRKEKLRHICDPGSKQQSWDWNSQLGSRVHS